MPAEERALFEQRPDLRDKGVVITSCSTKRYNCVAWAAGEDHRFWSPAAGPDGRPLGGYYWPPGVPSLPTVSAVEAAFNKMGFTTSHLGDVDLETGVDKVAIYGEDQLGLATHAARQDPSGRWLSKMGELADIEHELLDVEGPFYGVLRSIMRRDESGEQTPQRPQLIVIGG